MDFLAFWQKYKRLFLLVGFVLLTVFLGYLIWSIFFKSQVVLSPTEPGVTSNQGNLPSANPGGAQVTPGTEPGSLNPSGNTPSGPTSPSQNQPISNTADGGLTKTTALNDSPSLSPTLSTDGNAVQYYNKTDGKFYRLNSNGDAMPLSDQVFHDVQNVTWAPNKNKAVLEYPDKSKIVYDFNTKKQITLPQHWEGFAFSNDSNQLVTKSLGIDPENRWLVVANADGSQAKALEYIGTNDAKVFPSWSPNNQSVALYAEGLDFNRQSLYFVGLNNENFKSTIIEGRGFESQWSQKGDKLLYSVYSSNTNFNPQLWVVNAQGDNIGTDRHSIAVQTWASKCTFVNNSDVYCAVPNDLQKGSGIVPDLAKTTQDSLYKINIDTGQKKLIAIPDGSYNISSLVVSPNQDKLYFTDATSQKIYKVDLQ